MQKRIGMWLAAVALLSAGLDVALAMRGGRGWGAGDALTAWVIALVGVLPFMVPALLASVKWPERVPGLLVGSLALLHLAVGIRFGPLVNAPLSSPPVLGTWLALGIGCTLIGWFSGPWLGRVAGPRVLGAIGVIGLLGVPVGLARTMGGPGAPSATAAADAPNVLVVTLDTTRPDHLGAYGRDIQTPHLDALAARGVVFEQAIAAAPQTGPSHLSLLTGRYPLTHGVVANGTDIGEQPMIATALRNVGYRTGAFVAAFPVHERFGFGQGYEVYDSDFSPIVGLHELAPMRALDAVVFRNLPRERTGDQVNTRALRWLRRVDDSKAPMMMWVHYYDPHGPYTPPAPYHEMYTNGPPRDLEPMELPHYWPADQRAIFDPEYLEAQYDAEITYTDALLGELFAAVNDLSRPTIVVVTADHGESMTEHGVLFDHGDDLYDTELKVPLIVAGPGVSSGLRLDCQTPSVDIVPTVFELLGIADTAERDGRSLAGALAGRGCSDRDAYASTVGERVLDPPVDHALRRPDVKYIAKERSPHELYLLEHDPDELDNVYTTAPGTEVIEGLLQAAIDGSVAPRDADNSEEVVEMLRQLGYVE